MRKKKRRGLFFLILGLTLMAIALSQLLWTGPMLQYAVAAPQPTEAKADAGGEGESGEEETGAQQDAPGMENPELKRVAKDAAERLTDMSDSLAAFTVAADKTGASLVSDNDGSATARLVAAGENYFAVYPKFLLSGRLPDKDELKYGDDLIVLDIDLAIKLFGISEPIDREVTIGETKYRVVGIVRHNRAPGEHDLYSAYIPLASAVKRGIQLDTVVVSAVPLPGAGAGTMFTSSMGEALPGGDSYDLAKESLRQRALLRLVIAALGAGLLIWGFQRVSGYLVGWVRGYRDRLKREYLRDMLGGVLLRLGATLGGYALLLGGCYLIGSYAIELVYRFPEWVPAVLVEWNDILTTFWSLVSAAAKPVQRFTQELKYIQFFGVILRWGMVSTMVGALMAAVNRFAKAE